MFNTQGEEQTSSFCKTSIDRQVIQKMDFSSQSKRFPYPNRVKLGPFAFLPIFLISSFELNNGNFNVCSILISSSI